MEQPKPSACFTTADRESASAFRCRHPGPTSNGRKRSKTQTLWCNPQTGIERPRLRPGHTKAPRDFHRAGLFIGRTLLMCPYDDLPLWWRRWLVCDGSEDGVVAYGDGSAPGPPPAIGKVSGCAGIVAKGPSPGDGSAPGPPPAIGAGSTLCAAATLMEAARTAIANTPIDGLSMK